MKLTLATSIAMLGLTVSTSAQTPNPFIGSWCALAPGGSLTKLDIFRVDGQAATGHYKYNGLPTQLDEPITGTIVDGVFRARIGNISWTLTRKGNVLEGTPANNRTGVTHYVQLKPC